MDLLERSLSLRYNQRIMARLFVALDLPLSCRERLGTLAQEIRGARWLAVEDLHLTLAFLGEVSPHQREDLSESLESIDFAAFSVDFSGIGFFPRRGEPTTLWVGCRPSAELVSLKKKVDRALLGSGFPLERRRFRPHVTIARLKHCRPRDLESIVRSASIFEVPGVGIRSFSVYSSQLGPEAARYSCEETYASVDRGDLPGSN